MPRRYDRAYYRVVYPLAARPLLRIGPHECAVIDLSETGIRFVLPRGLALGVGDALEAHLILPSGDEYEVEGLVRRVVPPQAAAYLTRGLPFAVILEQQRDLQSRFPHWIVEIPPRP
jgi:hypothetical protein